MIGDDDAHGERPQALELGAAGMGSRLGHHVVRVVAAAADPRLQAYMVRKRTLDG